MSKSFSRCSPVPPPSWPTETVDDLPQSASPREWFRVHGDPAVYVGNGPTQPLTKLRTNPR